MTFDERMRVTSRLQDRVEARLAALEQDPLWPSLLAQDANLATHLPALKADIEASRRSVEESRARAWRFGVLGARIETAPIVLDSITTLEENLTALEENVRRVGDLLNASRPSTAAPKSRVVN